MLISGGNLTFFDLTCNLFLLNRVLKLFIFFIIIILTVYQEQNKPSKYSLYDSSCSTII